MQRDRSLDEFLGEPPSSSVSDAAEAEDAPDAAGADVGDADAEATDASGVAAESSDGTPRADVAPDDPASAPDDLPAGLPLRPAAATMAWTPGGAPCAACEERVERRWRDGDRLVCEACKEW